MRSKMPEVEFQVLCANRTTACHRVKSLMSDFGKLKNGSRHQIYDHSGKRYFDTVEEAIIRRNDLFDKAEEDVIGIELIIYNTDCNQNKNNFLVRIFSTLLNLRKKSKIHC